MVKGRTKGLVLWLVETTIAIRHSNMPHVDFSFVSIRVCLLNLRVFLLLGGMIMLLHSNLVLNQPMLGPTIS